MKDLTFNMKRRGFRPQLRTEPLSLYCEVVRTAIDSSDVSKLDSKKLLGALRARDFSSLLANSDIPSPQLYGSAAQYFADCQINKIGRASCRERV